MNAAKSREVNVFEEIGDEWNRNSFMTKPRKKTFLEQRKTRTKVTPSPAGDCKILA